MGWFVVLPIYTGLSFLLLSAAYAGLGPRLLSKKPTGQHSLVGWLLFAPYYLFSSITFGLYRSISREPAWVEVIPNLSFGRRLSARELLAGGWKSVLDLAGEFPANSVPPNYRSIPVLDTAAPTETEMRAAITWIAESMKVGPVYVHCALGHGRSACLVVAYLLSVGEVRTAGEGVRRLQSLRPRVALHRPQLRLLKRFEPEKINPEDH